MIYNTEDMTYNMKKIILTFVVAASSLVAFSQAPPPPPKPGENPNGGENVSGDRVGRSAPIGGELVMLSILAVGYALHRKNRFLSLDEEQHLVK